MAEREPGDPGDPRQLALIGAALFLAGLGLSAYLFPSLRRAGSSVLGSLGFANRPTTIQREAASAKPPQAAARFPGAMFTMPERPVKLSDIVAAFVRSSTDPELASAIAGVLTVDGPINNAWAVFRRTGDRAALIKALKQSAPFQRLLAQSARDPALRGALERALQVLGLGGTPGASLRDLASGGSSARSGRTLAMLKQDPTIAGFGAGASKPGLASGEPVDGRAGARTAEGGRGMHAASSDAGGSRQGFGEAGARHGSGDASTGNAAAKTEAAAAGIAAAPAGKAEPGANEVDTHLKPINAAVSDPMQKLLEVYPWLAPLQATGDLARIAEAPSSLGLWGACFQMNIYSECAGACSASGGKCTLPPGGAWGACKEYLGGDAACVNACKQQPGGCPTPPGAPPPASFSYVEIRPNPVKAGDPYTLVVIGPNGPYSGPLDAWGTDSPEMREQKVTKPSFMPGWGPGPVKDGDSPPVSTGGFDKGHYCGRFAPAGSNQPSQEVCVDLQ